MNNKFKILIADDEVTMRMILNENLQNWGYEVIEAENGKEALEILTSENPPRLAILDWMMPELDGVEVCRKIVQKKSNEIPFIYRILLTSKDTNDDLIEALYNGAHTLLTKPVNPLVLLSHIEVGKRLIIAEDKLQEYNHQLELKVAEQVKEIEKKKSLERFLAPQIVEKINQETDNYEMESARKELTIFFSDIRGFTPLSESSDPIDTVNLLNEYLSEMTTIIFKYEGTLDKFMGDGIMVFFGDPIPQSDHSLRAVKMAVEMQQKIKELSIKWQEKFNSTLDVGIGITTGVVTVGNIGSINHMDYTVIGHAVNVASRLESIAGNGEILISPETYGLVKDNVILDSQRDTSIKGVKDALVVYKIKGMKN